MSIKDKLLEIRKEKSQIHLNFLPDLKLQVEKETSFLDKYNPTNGERIYCILNDIKEKPMCKSCGKPVKFGSSATYKTFCSVKCANNDEDKLAKAKETCREKYGVDNPMKNNDLKEKSRKNLKDYIKKNKKEINDNFKKKSLMLYGTEHPMKNETMKEKLKSTMKEKYGVDNPMKISSIKKKNHDNNKSLKNTFRKSIEINKNRKGFLKEVTPLFDMDTTFIKNTENKYKCNHCDLVFTDWVDSTYKFIPRCPNCKPKVISKNEIEIRNFIKKYYTGKILFSDRTVLNGKELDIYLPDINVAIEYNGLYWHRYPLRDKNYHLNKTVSCEELGIRLIHIFSDEWLTNRKLVKKKLLHIINENKQQSLYARKCTIKEIDSKLKNTFLNRYHIQGEDKSKINLGLFASIDGKNKLVSVMTFCKPRVSLGQKDSKYDYELSRFASTNNYKVVGAFSKLLKYFERNYEWNTLITYADRRWSNGNVYLKNNWIHLKNSQPSYWYFKNDNERYHRYTFRKDKAVRVFNESSSLTEYEIMYKNGYNKIYDCGNKVFEFRKSAAKTY